MNLRRHGKPDKTFLPEVGALECITSYSAMVDTESKQHDLTPDASSLYYDEDSKEEEGEQPSVVPDSHQADEVPTDSAAKFSPAKSIKKVVSSVLPHVEPLHWTTFVCLSGWCTIP